jgi:hypothetical protein
MLQGFGAVSFGWAHLIFKSYKEAKDEHQMRWLI